MASLASFFAPLVALALLFAGELRYSYSPQTDSKGQAYIEISGSQNERGVQVTIKGSNGQSIKRTVDVKAGRPSRLTWTQKDRSVSYDIKIEGKDSFAEASFEVVRPVSGGKRGNFQILSSEDDIINRGTIRYRTSFDLANHTFQVFDSNGDKIVDKLVTDKVVPAGEELKFSWDPSEDVFLIKLRGENDIGGFAESKNVIWSVNVPHTEVTFDSGKANIKKNQEAKLDDAFAVIVHELDGLEQASKALGADIKVQAHLYIVGYTDTVGKAAKNQRLSEERARSIARYFADKGVWSAISYAGMGEKGLAVNTPDSTDEVRNRRALYLLQVNIPAGGGPIPSPNAWRKLTDARPRMIQSLPPLPSDYLDYESKQRSKKKGSSGHSSTNSALGADQEEDDTEGDSGRSPASDDSYETSAAESGSDSDDSAMPRQSGDKPGASAKGCQVSSNGRETSSSYLAIFLFAAYGSFRRFFA